MTTLFRGGEDIDFSAIGGSYGLTNAANIWINTTAGAFRAGYARCALSVAGNGTGFGGLTAGGLVRLRSRQFSASEFWFTGRLYIDRSVGSWDVGDGVGWLYFLDAGLVKRLVLHPLSQDQAQPFAVQKVTAAGVITTLGMTTSSFSNNPSSPDKVDVYVKYATAGACRIYINGTLVFNFTGDLTTDGASALAFFELGSVSIYTNTGETNNWSELIVSTEDTRNQSLVTRVPAAAGNADAWAGLYSDVNGLRENDASPNLSSTAAQIQEYTVNALPTGNFAILDVTQVARVTRGATGPQHVQLGNRTHSADFLSTDIAPSVAWDTYSYTTAANPSTGVAYTTSELNAAGYNIAMKSTA
jgi:hypothetical protein